MDRQTATWHDAARQRVFSVDLYVPAPPPAALVGLERVIDPFPVVLFAHGWSGQRGECGVLCTHLASHGYRVVCADFPGTTLTDVRTALQDPAYNFQHAWDVIAESRLADVPFLISAAAREFGEELDRVGLMGTSLGGWTALMAPTVDTRVRAVVALCPMGGDGPLAFDGIPVLGRYLKFEWPGSVAVTCLVADRDSWFPLYGQIDVFRRIPSGNKRLVVLRRADHLHFVDDVSESHASFAAFTLSLDAIPGATGLPWQAMSELIPDAATLMPEVKARAIVCGVATLQMDAGLKDLQEARSALEDVDREFGARHLDAYALRALSSHQ